MLDRRPACLLLLAHLDERGDLLCQRQALAHCILWHRRMEAGHLLSRVPVVRVRWRCSLRRVLPLVLRVE